MSYRINIDASKLSSPRFWIPGLAGSLESTSTQTLQVEPGKYVVQTHASSDTTWSFEITAQGLIDYAIGLDVTEGGFLAGRNSAILGVIGFLVSLDYKPLVVADYRLEITGWLPHKQVQETHLLPGHYQFSQGTGEVADAVFTVHTDGKLSFDATRAGQFMELVERSATSPPTVRFKGIEVVVDYEPLVAADYRLDITGVLPQKQARRMRLMPKNYQFLQGTGAVTDAVFTVHADGTLGFDSTRAGGFMELDDSNAAAPPTVRYLGYAIDLDFTHLSGHSYRLDLTDHLTNDQVHHLRLMPTRYQLCSVAGVVDRGVFEVMVGGTVSYAEELDTANGGYLTGAGSAALGVIGFPIGIDATAVAGTAATILPEGIVIDTNSADVQTVWLLPQYDIQLVLQAAPSRTALFDLFSAGSVALLEPYPFVSLGQVDGHPLIRLTHDMVRVRRPCGRPTVRSI